MPSFSKQQVLTWQLPPLRRYYSFHDAESDDDTSFAKRVDAVTFKKLLLYCVLSQRKIAGGSQRNCEKEGKACFTQILLSTIRTGNLNGHFSTATGCARDWRAGPICGRIEGKGETAARRRAASSAGAGTHADDVSVGASSRASASPGASSGSHPNNADPYCSSSCSKPSARLYAIYASV